MINATYEELQPTRSVPPQPPSAQPTGMARAQKIVDQSKSSLRLHGEVAAREPGGGPRLVVNVEATDDSAGGPFDGQASFMLLVPNRPPSKQTLARWDFSAEDVQTARDDAADDRTLRFYLELPADTPIDQSTELWVRLVPRQGEKLLAHTSIDLALPGRFASSTESGTTAMAASAAAPVPDDATRSEGCLTTNMREGDWSIARPGEPANLPSAEDILTGGWRTSSEPAAIVAKAIAIARPQPMAVRQARHVEDSIENRPAPTYKTPTWSPERTSNLAAGADADAKHSANPPWSATR